MAIVVPSILEENWENFHNKLEIIIKIPGVKKVQVDFSDGQFTPHKDLQISELDLLNPAFEWEAHLMVKDPRAYFFDAKLVGFTTVIFHFEAVSGKNRLASLADELAGLKIATGLAVNPETPIEDILPYLGPFKVVTLMGVRPGAYGQQMLPDTAERVGKLRSANKDVIIEVDGGVKISNIKQLADSGADQLIANSALFDTGQDGQATPAQNYENLSNAIL